MVNNIIKTALATGKTSVVKGAAFYGMYKAFDAVNTIGNNLLGSKIPAPAVIAVSGLALATGLKTISKNKTVHEMADMAGMAAVFTLLMRTQVVNSNVDKLLAPLKRIGGTTKGYDVIEEAGMGGYEDGPTLLGYQAAETTEGYEYADPRAAMRGYTSRHALVAA